MQVTQNIELAVSYLRSGALVAFPTETVYGLGADASNTQAIKRVFAVKGRPIDHPLIVHLGAKEQLNAWAIDIPASAWLLAEHFWPGALTLILKKHPSVSELITGGQTSIGLRIPQHPLTLELLRQFGSGLIGPSANKYGRVSPTTAVHVANDLGNEVAAILDGGPCQIGIESTIINLTADQPTIMRQGAISAAEISAVLKYEVAINTDNTIRTSGSHESHYAPSTPVFLIAADNLLNNVLEYLKNKKSCSVISLQDKPTSLDKELYWQQVPNDPKIYAQHLYANLRSHDQLQNAAILIEQVPTTPMWAAISDRLTRASFKE